MDRLVEEDDLPAMDSDDDQFLLEMSEESMEANETTAKGDNEMFKQEQINILTNI